VERYKHKGERAKRHDRADGRNMTVMGQPIVDFLAQELLPWVRQHYHVTTDPTRTVVGGFSYGGLAATFAGLRCSEAFGNILVQSGSFSWKPEDDTECEWLAREIVASPLLSLYNGGHDYVNWRGTLADGLLALFGA